MRAGRPVRCACGEAAVPAGAEHDEVGVRAAIGEHPPGRLLTVSTATSVRGCSRRARTPGFGRRWPRTPGAGIPGVAFCPGGLSASRVLTGCTTWRAQPSDHGMVRGSAGGRNEPWWRCHTDDHHNVLGGGAGALRDRQRGARGVATCCATAPTEARDRVRAHWCQERCPPRARRGRHGALLAKPFW